MARPARIAARKIPSAEKAASPARPTTWATTPKTAKGIVCTTQCSMITSVS